MKLITTVIKKTVSQLNEPILLPFILYFVVIINIHEIKYLILLQKKYFSFALKYVNFSIYS
jgi:hypothetical protein